MASTPSSASSRSSLASPYKRTVTYSKRDRARASSSRHPQIHPPTPQTTSRNATKEVIDLSNDDSDADFDVRALLTTPTCQTRSRSQDIALPAEIGKRLADALKEQDAINKEIEQYEAAMEDENTCEMCAGIIWQPCILPCGHALCAECIYDYVYYHLRAGQQLHSTTCAYCRAPISRPPVLSLEWQDRVDDMAIAKGIPIPERTEFIWPPPPGTPKRLRSDNN